RDDAADAAGPIQHGDTADLVLLHLGQALLQIGVVTHRHHVVGHHFGHGSVGAAALGNGAHDDVTVGDHAEQERIVAILDDGNLATVVFEHHPGHVGEQRIGGATGGIGGHYITDDHGLKLPFQA